MKYKVVGTTLIHGDGKNRKMYQPGDVVELPKEEGDANRNLESVGMAKDAAQKGKDGSEAKPAAS